MSVCHSFVSLVQSLVNIHVYTQWYLSLYTFILYPSSFVNHHTYMIIRDTPPIAQQSIPPGPQLWTAERKTNELGDRDVACSSLQLENNLHMWLFNILCPENIYTCLFHMVQRPFRQATLRFQSHWLKNFSTHTHIRLVFKGAQKDGIVVFL